MRLLALLVLLALAGCGTKVAGVSVPPAPQTPDQALFLAETDFHVAMLQTEAFEKLPQCAAGVTASATCWTKAEALAIYNVSAQGATALGAAKKAVAVYDAITSPTSTDQSTAVAAIAALAAIVPQITALLPPAASSS